MQVVRSVGVRAYRESRNRVTFNRVLMKITLRLTD
jgi:hypothetical protein